jgi:hypothetical protein
VQTIPTPKQTRTLGEESDIQKQVLDHLKLKRYVFFKRRNVGIMKPNGS